MPTTITTVSVHPNRAARLREFRDERGVSSMDAALETLLNEADTASEDNV
jgi:hypothetical protein